MCFDETPEDCVKHSLIVDVSGFVEALPERLDLDSLPRRVVVRK